MYKRVVVTGMSGLTSLGSTWDSITQAFHEKRNGIINYEFLKKYKGLNTELAGPILDFKKPDHYDRKSTRSMDRVALFSTVATEAALKSSGLLECDSLTNGDTGIAYGSSTGSTAPVFDFAQMLLGHTTKGITATTYIKMMPHTTCVNTGLFFGVKGRVIPTSCACASASQAIGYAYEAIKYGKQKAMIAGGAEEFCPTEVAVFDTLYATSTLNDTPNLTPRPFDKDRDGLVIGEGAGTFILEEYEHAKSRGATILAELVGFGTNCDAQHVTQPSSETMEIALRLALDDASLAPEAVGFVSAHGTATAKGDVAESHATNRVYGKNMPIHSLKSYFGHTLGGCGAIEAWLAIEMMNRTSFAPTLNLKNIDPACAELDYIKDEHRTLDCEYITSNNFAFGGINTSLVFKRV